MDVFNRIQIFLLALGSAICFLIVVFSQLVEYRTPVRKRALLILELSTSFLLAADMLNYIYMGNTSTLGFWVERICNFLLFFLMYLELFGFNLFIGTFNDGEENKIAFETKAVNTLSLIGMGLVIITQFTGWLYTFDKNNNYVRGPLFIFSYVAPFLILILTFVGVIKMKESLSKLIFFAALGFVLLQMFSSFLQFFFYGTSLANLSIGITVITLFALSLVDQNAYLRKIAETEKMTGLPNAHGFMLELEKIQERNQLALYDAYYFDIVRMGLVNRKYGNPVGDYVIKSYVKKIREQYMEKDEVLGRLGGNFFVAMVKREHTEKFLKILGGVDISLVKIGIDDTIRVSSVAGVYQIIDGNIIPDQIMTNIAMAVSIAKNVKKKPYIFLTESIIDEMNEQRHIQELIPICMEKREFIPFYQPKVNIEAGRLCGAEALCRWNHKGEYIPPFRFIPILEKNDFMCKFDFYMLECVCEDIKRWLKEGMGVPVISVNFSRKNLGNPNFVEDIYETVKKHDIPCKLVQIEITETIDEYPLEYLKDAVTKLQGYGFTTAIDDFGVGSSSLRLLKDVSFDVLKIDKSFVDTLTEKDCKFLRHIVEMANEIGASVISEGVETKEQVEVLKGLGCYEIQGYYFDKPLHKDEFEGRLKNPVYN